MLFEVCIICFMVFALWIIGKLLMLYDIVHVPKKRIHYWRHVKYLNHVSFYTNIYCVCVCGVLHCFNR